VPKKKTFYDEVDSLGIVEEHIQSVLALENEQAEGILGFYSDARNSLVKKLAKLPKGSFSAQHLRGVLAQVQGAVQAINSKLQGEMISGASEAAMDGVGHLVDELQTFDGEFLGAVTPINLDAAVLAHDTTKFLVTKYKTNLDDYGQDLLTQIGDGLFSAAIGEMSHEQVVARIGNFFTAEEWKLRRIVRTELHNVYNMGKINAMQSLVQGDVPDLMKTLMHPLDQRTGEDSKYAAKLGLIAEIDEPFVYEWKGQLREFMAPPDRPNDRAILVPYRTAWGSARGPAFLPDRGEDAYPL
jgi:hypothetical protein